MLLLKLQGKDNMQHKTGDKYGRDKGFLDFSDYGRPFARFFAKMLMSAPIGSITVTWFYTIIGFYAAWLIWHGQLIWFAALLLPFKSALDALDGQIARMRNRPSYVGRYLDPVNDFFINLFLFISIGHLADLPLIVVVISLILATFQGTVAHYYEIMKRFKIRGDTTSRIDESKKPKPYPWDNPISLTIVYNLYMFIYGWQEKIMRKLDPMESSSKLPNKFLSLMSLLGLGWQLLMICVFLLIGKPIWAIYYFIIPSTIYMVLIISFRRLFLQKV